RAVIHPFEPSLTRPPAKRRPAPGPSRISIESNARAIELQIPCDKLPVAQQRTNCKTDPYSAGLDRVSRGECGILSRLQILDDDLGPFRQAQMHVADRHISPQLLGEGRLYLWFKSIQRQVRSDQDHSGCH